MDSDTATAERPGIWFNDSNVVALIKEMNAMTKDAAQFQMSNYDDVGAMELGRQLYAEHSAAGVRVDSVAQASGLAPARPALADSLALTYATQVSALLGLGLKQLEQQFVLTQLAAHERAVRDLEALASATTTPDLQSLMLTKLIPMERAHIALLKRRQIMRAQADSAARATLGARAGTTR